MHQVVIVEDHPVPRDKLCETITQIPGMKVALSIGFEKPALEYIETSCPDILLVDLALPLGGSGLKIIRRAAKKWGNNCIIVVLAADRNEDLVFHAIRAGAVAWLCKDEPPQTWKQQLKNLPIGKSTLNARLAGIFLDELRKIPLGKRVEIHPKLQSYLEHVKLGNADVTLSKIGISPAEAGFFARRAYELFHESFEELSERQQETLTLIAQGLTTKECAAHFKVSESSVKTHILRLYEKLEVRTQSEALEKAKQLGLIV